MKVTQEKLPASQIGLEIEIPAQVSKQTYEKVIQELARTANIPGFRKGKVPRQILLQRLGHSRIKATALEELIQKSLQQALEQESIEAIGNYQLRSSFEELVSKFQPGEPLTFSAAVDVQPEVKLEEYKGLHVKAEEVAYDPSQVDKFLEERRIQQATLIPVEGRPAQLGDVAVVDYKGRFVSEAQEEGEQDIPGAQGTDFQIELGEGRFIQDFIEGIAGMSPGETKEVPVQFPADYGREDLASKSAVFTITLKELKEKELPPLDDDFAQEISEFETLSELRESLETRFREKAERETTANKEQAISAELLKKVEIELPESMIGREVESMVTQTAMQMGQMGVDVRKMFTEEMVQQLRSRSRPDAITRLKQSLALEEVAKRESLEVAPQELETRIKEVRTQLEGRDIDETRLREFVQSDLSKEKALKWLEENATIELVPQGSLTEQQEATGAEAATEEAEGAGVALEAETAAAATERAEASLEAQTAAAATEHSENQ